MFEKRFALVPIQVFTADGGANGSVSIADTSLFKVKQRVVVQASGQTNLELEVKKVSSPTVMILGPITGAINTFTDLSAFTTAAAASVFANEQKRPTITGDDFERAVYEEEPVVAKRVVLVDEFGNKISEANPLPTTASIGDITIGTVDQGDPNTLANGWPVKVTDGTNILGTTANPIKVDPTGTTTQPVSIAAAVAVTGPVTDIQLRATPVPVSGTVTANIGTTNGLALNSTLIDGTQRSKITDGVNNAAVDLSGSLSIKAKQATSNTSTTVAASITNVTLLASNADRIGATVYNDSTAFLYLKLGATASTSSYTVKMGVTTYFEVPYGYIGRIDGIWASANGNAIVGELI